MMCRELIRKRPSELARTFQAIILLAASLALSFDALASNLVQTTSGLAIKVLSGRPDLLSGGDALVEVVLGRSVDPKSIEVHLGAQDVTDRFAIRSNGRFLGLLTGIEPGVHQLTARASDGSDTTTVITMHSIGGPLIYAPQVMPWRCDSGALDPQCDRPPTYSFLYRSTDPTRKELLPYDSEHPASDVATTRTDAGNSAPFIVRVESGVIDRDYYHIAALFNPGQVWTPWEPQQGWNHKVVYMHGAGWGLGFGQFDGVSASNVLNVHALARGFAVLSSALNDNGHDGNLVVQAEAMIMLRQHFIEAYGEIAHAIGVGNSGGSLAEQWVANAYPGIYDGIIAGYSFPDAGSAAVEAEDCALLHHYFTHTRLAWSEDQKRAVEGQAQDVCLNWVDHTHPLGLKEHFGYPQIFDPGLRRVISYPGISPTAIAGCDAPAQSIYNPVKRPKGVRCDIQDYAVGIFGIEPRRSFARRPYSNVGVQYGLIALEAGAISAAQFADLNSEIGSHDIDDVFQHRRSAASREAVSAAYRSGWINEGNGLAQVAMLDVRSPDLATIHHQFRSWVMRARLDAVQGHHHNQIIWFSAKRSADDALDAMDAWLTAVERDPSERSRAEKIASDRPDGLTDLCGERDGSGLTMLECTAHPDGSPRNAAGSPASDDFLQCQPAPFAESHYPVAFTPGEWALLKAAFPTGVCDYSAGTRQTVSIAPWLTYVRGDGNVLYGGEPLPDLPGS
jgi:hypothetical protein